MGRLPTCAVDGQCVTRKPLRQPKGTAPWRWRREFSRVRTWLLHWINTNRIMLTNTGALLCTTLVTSALGFVYWWLAARLFSPEAVGLASASISAMTLLSTISLVGLGSLLINELPRQQ